MRIPVVDVRGIPLMPCTPPKARGLLTAGKARPKRNKLGLFYIQLTYAQAPNNQQLVVGIDPGSSFEGYSVVGTKETVCNLMVEAPTHVKKAVETRRTMRRARRFRLWRRPCRSKNRLADQHRLPPSTRSRWEAKARIVQQLAAIVPLTDVAVEDVQAEVRYGTGGHWNQSFSPVQVGKEHLYQLLKQQRLILHLYAGIITKHLRDHYGLTKTSQKDTQTFSSHAVDAWSRPTSSSRLLGSVARLPQAERNRFVARYEEILAAGLAANPPHLGLRITAAGRSSPRRAIAWSGSGWDKAACLPSSTTSPSPSITTKPSGICACSKSSKRCRAASVRPVAVSRSLASGAICPR
jgi:hypothetical protein